VSSSGALSGGRAYVWFDGRLVAMGQAGQAFAVYDDQLGRPRRVLDGAGSTVWSAKNLGFDRSVLSDGIGGLGVGFAGQYFDAESGLWQNWHRSYDGTIGRYTQSDPIGLDGGINTYKYAGGNPISNADPDGLNAVAAIRFGWSIGWNIGNAINPYVQPYIATAVDALLFSSPASFESKSDAWMYSKGERGYAGSPAGTSNPGKHWRDDPKNPGWGWEKDPQTGKKKYKKKPPYVADGKDKCQQG
jgi:RHS repeat-associated protein